MNMACANNCIKVPLIEILDYVIGGDWGKAPDYLDDKYGLAYCIRGSEFRNWQYDKGKTAPLRKIKLKNISSRKLQEGDLLIEISGGGPDQPVGRTVIIDKSVLNIYSDIPKICTNFLRLARPSKFVNPQYLNYFLTLFYKSGEIDKYQSGSSNLRNLKFQKYLSIEVPLLPFSEQQRIVLKIEELYSKLDKGIESLKAAQEQLKIYRQAVLKWAFEGKLTNDDVIEGELPKGWTTLHVAAIGKVQLGRQRSPKNVSRNYPTKYLRAANITENGLNLTNILEMEFSPKEFFQYKLIKGDIILSEASGSASQVGKPAIWKDEIEECCFQNTIIRLQADDRFVKEYLLWTFKYFYSSGKFAKISGGVGINHLSANKFSNIELSIPVSKEEQSRVVTEIESRLSVCDKLEESIAQSLQQAEALRQSILKKAFEGKLVPQDPNDEPASVLLNRIRAERNATVAKNATAETRNPRKRARAG